MSKASDSKTIRLNEFDRICRERGLPLTVQRHAVLEAVLGREDHPTADQIYDKISLKMPSLSRTTVYRILDTLVQTGMVTKVCHPGSAARFDPKVRQHHHLVCMRCERIFDIESPHLDAVPWPNVRGQGFEISDYHIHFRGTCADCLRELKKETRLRRSVGRQKAAGKAASRRARNP